MRRVDEFLKLTGIDRDVLRALQLSYYVDSISLASDYEFDMMEREFTEETGKTLPLGCDLLDRYTPAERALALYLQLRLKGRSS